MTALFSQVLNMSLTGSAVILLVLLVRLFLKRSPKIFSYALWSVVLFRLLCPVSLSAPVSFLELLRPQVTAASDTTSVVYYLPAERTPEVAFVPAEKAFPEMQPPEQDAPGQGQDISLTTVLACIWLLGAAGMILYGVLSWVLLRRKLTGAMVCQKGVYLADHIGSPFVMGVLRPKVYLPSHIPVEERSFILAHEHHHIRRLDHITKLLAYGALCIHWFNPLVWIAFVLAGRDMEMSCDEAVIRKLGPQIRANYSASLLRLATHRRIIAGTPLAFGEGDTKGRVMNMAKWKKPGLWASIVCVTLCIAVLVACAVNPQEDESLPDLTRTSGPASVGIGELSFTLPEGYSIEAEESVSPSGGSTAQYDHIIRNSESVVGGVYQYPYPETERIKVDDSWKWVEALNIPENVPEELYMMNVTTPRFETYSVSVSYGKNGIEEKVHYLYEGNDAVYDLWFDMRVISAEEADAILKGAQCGTDGNFSVSAASLFGIGQLPDGYFYTTDKYENIDFRSDSRIIGGITAYPIPEGVYDPNDKYFFWLEEVGIPDFEDPTLCYMGGITSGDTGWLAEFASDVPEGTAPTVNRRHHFYPINGVVYDIWFDMLQIDIAASGEILSVVSFPEFIPAGTEESDKSEEDIAFENCLAVMQAVQNGSYSIASQWENDGTYFLNDSSSTVFYQHEGNLLSITEIPEDGGSSIHGCLYVDDSYYDNQGSGWSEEGKPFWEEKDPPDDQWVPWLSRFVWTKSQVSYMDTMTDEAGTCYMYRIDFKYEDREDYADHYFVNFYFDPQGNFRHVTTQVNLFMDNGFTVTESIVSLDAETVAAAIDTEYRRATELE